MTWLAGNFSFGASTTVGLGIDRSVIGTDNTSPYDARAGFRLNYNSGTNGFMQTGKSPTTGGSISTWTTTQNIADPTPYTCNQYEYKWEEITNDGGMTLTTPVAVSTWQTWNATKTWTAKRTLVGSRDWVIDVYVRNKTTPADVDVVRISFQVEGL